MTQKFGAPNSAETLKIQQKSGGQAMEGGLPLKTRELKLGMELTWLAIAASLFMAMGAALLFYCAVKKDWMKDIEDARYQVFWSDLDELVNTASVRKANDGDQPEKESPQRS